MHVALFSFLRVNFSRAVSLHFFSKRASPRQLFWQPIPTFRWLCPLPSYVFWSEDEVALLPTCRLLVSCTEGTSKFLHPAYDVHVVVCGAGAVGEGCIVWVIGHGWELQHCLPNASYEAIFFSLFVSNFFSLLCLTLFTFCDYTLSFSLFYYYSFLLTSFMHLTFS